MRRTALGLPIVLSVLISVPPTARADEGDPRRTAVVRAVEAARPATVAIHTTELVYQTWAGIELYDLPPMNRDGLGSGTIFHPAGFVITNAHVIARASQVLVAVSDRQGGTSQREARIVAVDIPNDLAILRLLLPDGAGDGAPYPYLPLGRSDDLMLGEPAIAVGNPFGLGMTITTGIVSGLNRRVPIGEDDGQVFEDFIQIDAAVNPGNSGGPLLDATGRWIGVTTAILNRRTGAEGIGFAIPADRVRSLVGRAFQRRVISGEWLGLEEEEGPGGAAAVGFVFPKGPARDAGIKAGDRIVSVNGRATPTLYDYRLWTADLPVGSRVALGIERDGRPLPKPASVALEPVPTDDLAAQHLGILVADVDEEVTRRLRIPMDAGVLVREIRPGSAAERIGLKPWDLLVGLGRKRIRNSDNLLLFLQFVRPGDVVEVTVQRVATRPDGRRGWQEVSGRLVAE